MIAVVTGGSGFIGRNLVDRLLRDGHTVRCLVRAGGGQPPRRTERFVVDYANPATLMSVPALEGADVVFHLAGATTAIRAADFREANVTPARHLLGALVARRLRPRYVHVSSQAAAGPAASLRRPVDESDVPRPVESYGRSKLDAERVVESFHDRVPAVIVRPCAVYGAHDRDFLRLFQAAQAGWMIYPGVRDHWLSLLHVDDVVNGLLRAAVAPAALCQTFFLGSSEPESWRNVGAAIVSATGRRVREVNIPRAVIAAAAAVGEVASRLRGRASLASRSKAALARDPYWVCSASRAREVLGFQPVVSLPEGIRRTYLWYMNHDWLPRR